MAQTKSNSSRSTTPEQDDAKNGSQKPENVPEAPKDREGNSQEPDPSKSTLELTSIAQAKSADAPPIATWQAIWSPQHNAYYFYNSVTQETTWSNPLQDTSSVGVPGIGPVASSSTQAAEESDSATTTPFASSYAAMQAAALAQGIDPSLAYLDPSLASAAGPSRPGSSFTAKFNARTGAFTAVDARDPSHLSEFERAKRMSEFYFDVGAWEREVEERKRVEDEEAAEGKKRKRPTKKDLDRFKEQKRLKKIAKTAWLRT